MFKNEKIITQSLLAHPELSIDDVAMLTGISRATLYKVKKDGSMSPKTFVKLYALYLKLFEI